jgi:uncharacterized protein (TIGR00106 family)
MILAQLSVAPVGKGISLSSYVQIIIDILEAEGVSFQTNPMSTTIETQDLTTLFTIVQKAHTAVINAGAKRVITELKIDDRCDKHVTMESKLKHLKFSK